MELCIFGLHGITYKNYRFRSIKFSPESSMKIGGLDMFILVIKVIIILSSF